MAAGAIVGVGVLVMHYIGMAGLELCAAVYSSKALLFHPVAIGLCARLWIAYGRVVEPQRLSGHALLCKCRLFSSFLAMAGTNFVPEPSVTDFGPSMSNETPLGVIFFSFVIFGACLWVSVTYLVAPELGIVQTTTTDGPDITATETADLAETAGFAGVKFPERDGGKVFVRAADVSLSALTATAANLHRR